LDVGSAELAEAHYALRILADVHIIFFSKLLP
jgi:hypothetical protein